MTVDPPDDDDAAFCVAKAHLPPMTVERTDDDDAARRRRGRSRAALALAVAVASFAALALSCAAVASSKRSKGVPPGSLRSSDGSAVAADGRAVPIDEGSGSDVGAASGPAGAGGVEGDASAKAEATTMASASGGASDFAFAGRNAPLEGCLPDEALWTLELFTDDYPWEISWELRPSEASDSDEDVPPLASGPSTGTNYDRRARFEDWACLLPGRYFVRWRDSAGDGMCCDYGPGRWTARVNGEVVLEEDPAGARFEERDFPFEVALTGDGDDDGATMIGTFLIMPRSYYPVSNVEFDDGRIYELLDLPVGFDYAERGLLSGVSRIALPTGSVLFSNGTASVGGKAPKTVRRLLFEDVGGGGDAFSTALSPWQQERRLASRFEGTKTVLAVRVIVKDDATSVDAKSLSDSLFGNGVDPVNLASQFKACSYGQLNFVRAPNRSGRSPDSGVVDISGGVATVRLPLVSVAEGHGALRNAVTRELNEIFGVASPRQLADYVIYCLPPGTTLYSNSVDGAGIAYAYLSTWVSVFKDKKCLSASLQMHELGHNLNMGHSNEDGAVYEDQTGIMGASYPNNDSPRMCFNAAKSWQTGWYRDKSVSVVFGGRIACFDGVLHGVAGYETATTVLVQVRSDLENDHFVNFNARRGINDGTQEARDQVTVVRRPRGARDSYADSELVAKLGPGMSYGIRGYIISVEKIDARTGTAELRVLRTGQNECS